MSMVANGKISAFSLQAGKSQNKKNTTFNLICLHSQKKIILETFIPTPTEYVTVKSGQEMDLAPVIAMNCMC